MQIVITDSSVLEVAMLDVIEGKNQEFEKAFELAVPIITSMPGYIRHELQMLYRKFK